MPVSGDQFPKLGGEIFAFGKRGVFQVLVPHDSPNVLEVHVVVSPIDLELDLAPSLPHMRSVMVSGLKGRQELTGDILVDRVSHGEEFWQLQIFQHRLNIRIKTQLLQQIKVGEPCWSPSDIIQQVIIQLSLSLSTVTAFPFDILAFFVGACSSSLSSSLSSLVGTATLFSVLFSCSFAFFVAKVCCREVLYAPEPAGSEAKAFPLSADSFLSASCFSASSFPFVFLTVGTWKIQNLKSDK
ncbi:hypothetical protein F2Q69_00008941 [Brassica cretica]|uniref:Uncharacterized protein n=1 Tax=Brassica cretica TaxID=69181 RepID=A0A8S9PHW8_BRACR|nr:hypothetical protein F2Q69_00008941 [Brassica cretica]